MLSINWFSYKFTEIEQPLETNHSIKAFSCYDADLTT